MRHIMVQIAALALVGVAPAAAGAQEQKQPPARTFGQAGGSGPYTAIAQGRADAPGYTIYRPEKLPEAPVPLVLWGNGGCRDNGLSASNFLREIASHGYIVIANGAPRQEPSPAADSPQDETSTANMLASIDWATQANERVGDLLFGRVDPTRIAVMGHSCGGLQALMAGSDPRISAVVAFASGVYIRPGSGKSGVAITKDDLKRLHTPVAYVLGGPTDIAYPNGMDDADVIQHVPVLVANQNVGHGGTFEQPNGGDWAAFAVQWLGWQLKGSITAGRWFVGADCLLCADPAWTITRKHFPEKS